MMIREGKTRVLSQARNASVLVLNDWEDCTSKPIAAEGVEEEKFSVKCRER